MCLVFVTRQGIVGADRGDHSHKDAKMLKKLVVAAGLLAAVSNVVQAEVIDLSTIKCSDIAKMSEEEGSYLMIWLHGYYGGKAGDTTMDTDSFESSGKAIGDACAESPELGLMTVINQIDAAQ
jgi:acid stress chaperone HdeB